jgi:hypothetical protein
MASRSRQTAALLALNESCHCRAMSLRAARWAYEQSRVGPQFGVVRLAVATPTERYELRRLIANHLATADNVFLVVHVQERASAAAPHALMPIAV